MCDNDQPPSYESIRSWIRSSKNCELNLVGYHDKFQSRNFLHILIAMPLRHEHHCFSLGALSIYHRLNIYKELPVIADRFFIYDPISRMDMSHSLCKHLPNTLISYDLEKPLEEFDVIVFMATTYWDIFFIMRILNYLKSKRNTCNLPKIIIGGQAANNKSLLGQFCDLLVPPGNEELLFDYICKISNIDAKYQHIINYKSEQLWDYASMLIVNNQASILLNNGCRNKCAYCTIPYAKFDYRSISVVKTIFDLFYANNANCIYLNSATLTQYPEWEKLFSLICNMNESNGGLKFIVGSIRHDELHREFLVNLLKACRPISSYQYLTKGFDNELQPSLCFAPEHGSIPLLKRHNRLSNPESLFATLSLCKYFGVTNFVLYFVLNLPGETKSDFNKLLDYISRLAVFCVNESITVTLKPTGYMASFNTNSRRLSLNEIKSYLKIIQLWREHVEQLQKKLEDPKLLYSIEIPPERVIFENLACSENFLRAKDIEVLSDLYSVKGTLSCKDIIERITV